VSKALEIYFNTPSVTLVEWMKLVACMEKMRKAYIVVVKKLQA